VAAEAPAGSITNLDAPRGGIEVRLRATPPFAGLRASSFLAPFGAALGNPEMAGRQTVRAPFGAALGNPEMAGRQTVRARTKNAFFDVKESESKTASVL